MKVTRLFPEPISDPNTWLSESKVMSIIPTWDESFSKGTYNEGRFPLEAGIAAWTKWPAQPIEPNPNKLEV
jgi:hypothetical protein